MHNLRTAGEPKTVLLVSDSQAIRGELQSIISVQTDMKLVGLAGSGDMPDMARAVGADVVVWERASMGIDFLRPARLAGWESERMNVIVVTALNDSRYAVRLLHAGALGCVLTDQAREDLPSAIRAAADCRTFISRGIAGIVGGDDEE